MATLWFWWSSKTLSSWHVETLFGQMANTFTPEAVHVTDPCHATNSICSAPGPAIHRLLRPRVPHGLLLHLLCPFGPKSSAPARSKTTPAPAQGRVGLPVWQGGGRLAWGTVHPVGPAVGRHVQLFDQILQRFISSGITLKQIRAVQVIKSHLYIS